MAGMYKDTAVYLWAFLASHIAHFADNNKPVQKKDDDSARKRKKKGKEKEDEDMKRKKWEKGQNVEKEVVSKKMWVVNNTKTARGAGQVGGLYFFTWKSF